MRCPECGSPNPEGQRFCGECGAALRRQCPTCGAPAGTAQKFCGECGAPLAAAAAPAATALTRPEPGPGAATERRICSVLFCDLVGFTPLSEARDPEEVRELLASYFETARTIIGRFGGVVEKFIGDAVMAVWGAPTAAEGDAERAVRAALDVVEAVAELGRERRLPGLAARAGVVTGEVAVTVGAQGQGMVAGDAVNTAARVQAVAGPGAVLVDEVTWRTVRSAVALSAAGEHVLKGKAEPVRLWQVERVLSIVGGQQRVDGLEARLVGRDAELRLVKELFHAGVERRTARLLSITGAAGVGKSRLGWEFEKYIDGLASTVWWHRGRCLAFGEGVAFWALAEMVRQRLAIGEGAPPALVAEKLEAGLDQWVPEQAARDYLRPRLSALLGAGPELAGLAREELFAGWRLFFEQLATTGPVVLLVEDLQHADTGFLDFLDHLLDWARDAPIFVLTLSRPELELRRPGWGLGRRNGTVLTLEPLDPAATRAMLDGLVPGMPEPARDAIAQQSQGVPLYAVETIRMLVDRDVVQPIDGRYRLVGDIGELAVPDTLQSLLTARLDELSPDARRLVSDAAVFGGSFPLEALVAVSGRPEEQIRPLLADLVRREVLTVRADRLSPERGQYDFVQNLFRQVAYDTQSRRERKARHLAAADHLSRAFPEGGEEMSEVIAHHLLDAFAAVPDDPDVPELRQRAVAALVRAGERAERTGAPATAARLYATAADLPAGGLEADRAAAARLWERAGAAATLAGEAELGAAHYERAGELYAAEHRDRDAVRAKAGLASALRHLGRLEEASRLLREALAFYDDDLDPEALKVLAELARMQALSAGPDAAELVDSAVVRAQAVGLPDDEMARMLTAAGLRNIMASRWIEAAALLREAVRLAEGSGNAMTAALAYNNLASTNLATDPAQAQEAARRGLQHARRIGAANIIPSLSGNLVQALLVTGDWAQAQLVLDELSQDRATHATNESYTAYNMLLLDWMRGRTERFAELLATMEAHASDDLQDLSSAAHARGLVLEAQGEPAKALTELWSALEIGGRLTMAVESVSWGWSLAADTALALGDDAGARRLLDWVDARPPGHVPRLLRGERCRIRGRLLAAAGDPAADGEFDAAVRIFRDFGAPFRLATGLLDRADHLAAVGDADGARRDAREAGTVVARLGAGRLSPRVQAFLPDDEAATTVSP